MILLDTNAILWILTGHRRASALLEQEAGLAISPVSLLELKFLIEVGRLEETTSDSLSWVANDSRWRLDNPTSQQLFVAALDLSWTRDPFDRLLCAHASSRQWKLATSDRNLKTHLPADRLFPL